MSDEILDEPQTNHVPQFQPKGRKRVRPIADKSDVIKALAEKNDALEKQMASVMAMLLDKATSGNVSGLPKKPALVPRPKGYVFHLEAKIAEEGIPRQSTYPRTVPERWDNPNEPDPRYCVFCSKQTEDLTRKVNPKARKGSWSYSMFVPNVAESAGEKELLGDIEFNEAQMQRILKLHRDHLREIHTYKMSDNKWERDCYLQHFNLTASRVGRVPDVVRFRTTGMKGDPGVFVSAEEMNQLNEAQWKQKCEDAVQAGR